MNTNKFWNVLSESSKAKVEEVLSNYVGSDGIDGRIFELYEEGATSADCTIEEYLKDVSPNEYVNYLYDAYLDRQC